MRRLLALAFLAATAGCALERTSAEDFESELTDSLADSLRAVSDASEAAVVGPNVSGADSTGCDATTQVIATQPLCMLTYASQVHVNWACVGPNGSGASGNAEVSTTLVPNMCPVSEVDATQSLTLGRQWRLGGIVATLAGTADLSWTASVGAAVATKTVSVDVVHQVSRGDEVLRDQHVTGTRTIARDENGIGPADDTRVVDGTLAVEFEIAGVHADVTETDLTFRRGCCHPVSGTLGYALTGEEERSGSILFGPACGAAETDGGRVLDLAPCIVD